MKLLHTADLHMDRAFEGLPHVPAELAERFLQANQNLLRKIIDAAIRHSVDVVLFVGDTFHQSRTSIKMQSFLMTQLARLDAAGIPAVLTFGNHDHYIKARYWFEFPKNVYLFDQEAVETIHFETKAGEQVFISGFSYEHAWIEESKVFEFPVKREAEAVHIGLYHGDTARKKSQNYAPFSITALKEKGYDYWALGHIHQPQVISAKPLIVYPGTPQGHTKKEHSLQGVAIATIESGHATVHFEPVAEIIWRKQAYTLHSCQTSQEVLAYLLTALTKADTTGQAVVLMELELTDLDELDETFQTAFASGEFLRYLQEQVWQKTQAHIWVFSLRVLATERSLQEKISLPAAPQLLAQLEKNYEDQTIFADTIKELLQQPTLSSLLSIDQAWRRQCIQEADHIIAEDFFIQEEQT